MMMAAVTSSSTSRPPPASEAAAAPPSSLVASIFGKSSSSSHKRGSKSHGHQNVDRKKKRMGAVDDGEDDDAAATAAGQSLLLDSLFGGGNITNKGDNKKIKSAPNEEEATQKASEADKHPHEESSDSHSDSDDSASSSSSEEEEDKAVDDINDNDELHDESLESPSSSSRTKRNANDDGEDDDGPNPIENHDNDVEDRTVFVGNLPLGTTRKTLELLFKGNGVCVDPNVDKVVSARIRRTPTQGVKLPPQHAGNQSLVQKVSANVGLFDPTKSTSCVGYVVFAHPSTVERALELNNMEIPDPTAPTPGATTRHIRVDRVRPVHDASRSVFVGNLPHHKTDEETLRQHVMNACSWIHGDDSEDDEPIEAVRVVRDPDFQCRGFAYILLRDKSLVPHVLQHLSDSTYMGRTLRVQVCGKRFKNRRGEAKALATSTSTVEHRRDAKRPRHNASRERGAGGGGGPHSANDRSHPSPMGALRRIMASQAAAHQSKSRRARGPTNNNKSFDKVHKRGGASSTASAGSKRSASHAKSQDRVKKLEKRLKKGMGKNKKSVSR